GAHSATNAIVMPTHKNLANPAATQRHLSRYMQLSVADRIADSTADLNGRLRGGGITICRIGMSSSPLVDALKSTSSTCAGHPASHPSIERRSADRGSRRFLRSPVKPQEKGQHRTPRHNRDE